MMTMRFGARALAHVRFAISPMVEARRSLRVLDDPGGQALHLPWVIEARRRTADLDLDPLRALDPRGVYTPDFISPPPDGPLTQPHDALAAIAATPPAQARAEVQRTYRGRELPAVLEPFVDDPAAAVLALAELMRAYWERALAPHWPRIRALLEGDVLHRARQMADGGAQRLFADVDPTVSWSDGVLAIEKPFDETLDLEDRGLLFVPSVFAWPEVLLITDPKWQPSIIYPARGVGMLWEPARPVAAEALGALLGRVRAGVLTALDRPRSTTDLAGTLGLSAGGVSQHLGVLRKAGLVHGHRVGRVVLYLRSPAGDGLVAAATSDG
jgi:DNA-binding transcriptional ArsR family regulator